MIRQFKLINGNGHEYSLMDIEHWLYQPKKLGAKFSSKYEQVDADFLRTSRISKPDDIKGKLLFTGKNAYADYFDFMKFVAVEPITLVYTTNAEYRASVDIKSIDKSEIEEGILECDIALKRLSRWYRQITILNDKSDEESKTYPHGYPYKYMEYEPQTATIESDSGYNSPTKITIFGPVENPTWKHYLNGDIIETGHIDATVRDSRRVVIDCTSLPYSIREYDNEGVMTRDLYQYSDFTTARFFNLAFGKNRITVEHGGTNVLNIAVEARLEYETV